MTITEYKNKLESYIGSAELPGDFEEFWDSKVSEPNSVCFETVPFCNETAIYEKISIQTETLSLHARCIRPNAEGRFPLVLMFHDLNRGVRGWHHMTRFIAQGYAVIALEDTTTNVDWKQDPRLADFERRYSAALTLASVAMQQPFVQADRVVTWGEGFGAGLAIVTAAMSTKKVRCAALNPMPADLRGLSKSASEEDLQKLDYVDVSNFAPLLTGELLMGICLMDQVAPPEGQYAIYNKAKCSKSLKVYPKYIHERVNFFENEVLGFLKD